MGWWPFAKKKSMDAGDNLHIKGTRVWIEELQRVCERHYDLPAQAHILIREMQVEWTSAKQKDEIDQDLFDGLERRAFYLLRADAKEWLTLLDDLDFWKVGWRPSGEGVNEGS